MFPNNGVGYGTWMSKGWANSAYFGENLAELIKKATTGKITHDEDKVFEINDFRERLEDNIYECLYH